MRPSTPSLGIAISAVTLGEPIGLSVVVGVALIATGIRLATKEAPVDELSVSRRRQCAGR